MKSVRIAIVGVSTLIGAALVEELRAQKFAVQSLHALDDDRHLGTAVGEEQALPVSDVAAFDFAQVDLVFFCGRSALSERYAALAAEHAWVIDGSAAFRERGDLPMVAADVNPSVLSGVGPRGLITLPGSASVALATVLAPLQRAAGLARVEVATYQAVSGSGRGAVEELAGETVAMLSSQTPRGRAFGRQIAFNVIPQVDSVEPDGHTREELRLWAETCRVLALPALPINVTAVRVPVFFGHSLVVHAALERSLSVTEATDALRNAAGVQVIDADSSAQYPTPATLASAPDKVYVGRIRADRTRERGLNFWVVADNVRKCAAHNAVSVAQILVNRPL